MTKRTILLCLAFVLYVTSWAKNDAEKPSAVGENRPKVGLVLGGGGAKGAAEVGVLKFIELADVKIDYIAGTSIGSIIGALYSIGYRAADLDSLFHSQEWLALLTDRSNEHASKFISRKDDTLYMFGFPIKKRKIESKNYTKTLGFSRGESITNLFKEMINRPDSIGFDTLPIPFRCVAVDLRKFDEVVLSSGNLAEAMRASMSIPGFFKPVSKDSMLLADGGLLNNLPVDVVRSMGAEKVIAIDLTQNKHTKRMNKRYNKPGAEQRKSRKTGVRGLLTWIIDRPDLAKYSTNINDIDVYINPDLDGYNALDFKPSKIAKMIRKGEIAGEAALDELKKLSRNQ